MDSVEQLVAEHLSWACRVAQAAFPGWRFQADLDSVAVESLWRAAQAYERDHPPYSFKQIARRRIRLAVITELRRVSKFPRRRGANICSECVGVGCSVCNYRGGRVPPEMVPLSPFTELPLSDGNGADQRLGMLEFWALAEVTLKGRPGDAFRLYLQGMTQEEIAAEWGVTSSRISQLIHEATRSLRAAARRNGLLDAA